MQIVTRHLRSNSATLSICGVNPVTPHLQEQLRACVDACLCGSRVVAFTIHCCAAKCFYIAFLHTVTRFTLRFSTARRFTLCISVARCFFTTFLRCKPFFGCVFALLRRFIIAFFRWAVYFHCVLRCRGVLTLRFSVELFISIAFLRCAAFFSLRFFPLQDVFTQRFCIVLRFSAVYVHILWANA